MTLQNERKIKWTSHKITLKDYFVNVKRVCKESCVEESIDTLMMYS